MIDLLPMPKTCEEFEGRLAFAGEMTLSLGSDKAYDEFAALAPELFAGFCAGKASLNIARLASDAKVAVLTKDAASALPSGHTDEDYELFVEENGCILLFGDRCGLAHAFSTLLQLISAYDRGQRRLYLPHCHIADSPALAFRGMHISVFPETSHVFLRKAIRFCGFSKFSHVALEFFGTYRYDCFPHLGWAGNLSLSREELRTIVREGRGLGLEFIPFFNHFGHAAYARYRSGKHVVLDQAPEYEELFEPMGWTWDIENPETLALQAALRRELCDIFGEGEYFHIGCDEAFIEDGRGDGYDKHDNDRFVDHVNAITEDLAVMGRKAIMWGDMLLPKNDFPYPYCRNVSFRCLDAERNLGRLNSDIIVDDWQYNIDGDKDETVTYFLEKGIEPSRLFLSPWKKPSNIKGRCDIAKKLRLRGVLGTMWHSLQTDFPAVPYAACHMWSEDASYTSKMTMDPIKARSLQNLRKLMPCGGSYEDAGLLEKQVMFKIPNDD